MNKELQARTKVDSSTTDAQIPSANLAQNPLLAAAFSSELVSKAREYATLKHFETNHKYDGQPYDVHLQMVYDFAVKYIHLLPNNKVASDVLAACWVHDVIEDCRQTYNDVKNVLGITVADIAYALTNEKGKNRKERANDKYYSGIRNTPYAAFIKICDRLANSTYSKQSGSSMINAYKKENKEFKEQLWSLAYQEMFDELAECFAGCC
jgi:(p)ppGpp synthase/HD superfamily hydrolase